MKRVLSLILALAMLISLVPAVSADGDAMQEYSGVTVKYGMVSGSGYDFSSAESEYRADTKKVTFADTNGFWSYHSASGMISVNIPNEYALRMETVVNDWVAIKIYVPKAGKYDITLGYSFRKSSDNAAQKAGAWIVPLNNAETGKEHTNDEIAAKLTEGTVLTTALDYNSDTSSTTGEHYMPAIVHSFPEPGVYLVVYKALEACKAGSTVARMYPGTIILDGKGEDVVPMLLSAEMNKTAIEPNGGTAQMTVTAVMSDGSVENVTDKVTYSVTGNATLSDNGLITGCEEGEATVTATLVFTGGELSASKTIKVANAGAKIFYDVGTAQQALKENGFLNALTKDYTNYFYSFYGTSSKTANPEKSGGHLISRAGGLQVHGATAATFEVYIPMTGNYTMEMWNNVAEKGRMAAVWIGKKEDISLVYTKEKLGKKVGNYLCYKSDVGSNSYPIVTEASVIKNIQIDEPGWYTLSFIGDNDVTAPEGVTWGSYIYVGDFWLTSGTGDAVPMKKSITVNEDWEASVSILLSDKSYKDLSGATITWKSSDTSVADIGKNDGMVDVYAIGETELTAEIYFDGVLYDTVKDTYKVTELPQQLPCADTVYTYNFFETISSDWAPYTNKGTENEQSSNPNLAQDTDIFDITYAYTDGSWEWFGAGPKNLTPKNARYTSNYLRIYPGAGRWYALTINVPTAGKYAVDFEYYARTATTANANIYIVPKPSENPKDVDALLTKKTYIDTVSFLAPSKDTVDRKILGAIDIETPGEYVLVFEQGDAQPSYFCPRVLRLDGINEMKLISFTAENNEVRYGEKVVTSITARLLDGTLLEKDTYSVIYESSNPEIAAVDENGVVTGKGHGEARITATVIKDGISIPKTIVFNAIDNTGIVGKKIKLNDFLYLGEKSQISVILSMQSGNEITLPREDVSFVANNNALRFEEAGYVYAAKECDSVTISANGKFLGEDVSVDKEISVVIDEGKTEATYYTTQKRENALENAATYDWAKSMKKSAEKTVEKYMANLDLLYDLIIAEGLPRSTRMGGTNDPYYNLCRYCDGGMNRKGSLFIINSISRPWQTQCPECKRLFPSNDFEGFLKLGLDREGRFDRLRALEAHRAMLIENGKSLPDAGISDERKIRINNGEFLTAEERAHYGFGVEGGYLVNKLYTELSDPAKIPDSLNNHQGLRAGEDWKTWGVDDGWGYVPLQTDGVTPYKYSLTGSDGKVQYFDERHNYVAYIVDGTMKDIVTDALTAIKDAYLYTGDIKYGRAGAILLDRIADVYHTYDLFIHNDIDYDKDSKGNPDRLWYNTDGGGIGIGIITGDIDSNNQAQLLALCADAFYPALSDTQVIDYLSGKAKLYGYDTLQDDDKYNFHQNYTNTGYATICEGECREYEHEIRRNAKTSSHDIWKNWENGIIRKNYWGLQFGRITGNFGQRQATASITAIVQDRQPETTEMLDWIYRYPNPDNTYRQGGGGVTTQLVDVIDRDGMGHESSVNYNRTQIEGLGKMSDFLADYKDGAKYNLYENPKFHEMFMAFVRPVVPEGHPKMGDVSTTLFHGFYAGDIEIWKNGFKNLRDTDIADELAQYIWTRNGRTTEGLHYDIFTKNPESFKEEVSAFIDETGALNSELMAGYGFAVLQDGGIYDSASASTEVNNQRAFWITAGDTDGHGHPDSLELNVDAFGIDLGADLGYPEDTSYTPNRIQWISTTMSHNTVMINKKNSEGNTVRGFPLHFNDSGMVKLMDIDATHKYAEAENYRRSLVMVKINDDTSYGVDFFRVTGGNHHTYIYHSASSKVNEVSGLKMATEPELIQVDKNGTMDWATYAGKDAAYVKNPDGSVRKAFSNEVVDFETVFPVTYGQDPWTQPNWSYEPMFPKGYTWLRNVRRAAEPQSSFTVDFEITDYKKALSNPKGIHLRMTQVNDFTPSGVAFAGGHVPQRSESSRNIGYKDAFNPDRATMLEYVYIEREAPEGQELDSLFTTVYEPYRNTSNIDKIEAVDVTKVSGNENADDMVRAVKVTHVGGERIDYVVYATNNSVKYNVGGVFDFQGFVGVYSTNSEGAPTYRYVHDGNIIGDKVESEGTLTGKVEGFERNLAFKNYIDISTEIEDASALAGEYIFIANDGADNAVYKIEGASVLENHTYGEGKNVIRLDIDRTTLIRGHQNATQPELGYVYNIAVGQSFKIPLSYNEDFSPEFAPVNDSITTSAGSTISVALNAASPVEENTPTITYIGTTLPRGASINAETGVFTWKPDSSQVGENHVAITARDSDGRETTIHFNVTVYGSTTGGSSSNNNSETPSENTGAAGDTSTPAGGGGGGGGGGAAPTDKSDDTTNTDDTDEDESLLLPEKVPSEGEAEEVEKTKFTDLDSHSWAEDAINTLAADGIIKGTSASTFSPAANITRADFAILLVRAFKLESENTENFADVSASDYFASELAIARNNGIISGIGDNKFAPRNSITRQDMMVIVYRALQKLNVGFGIYDEPQYSDYSIVADYAKEAAGALISAGLVNGKSGRIAPTDYTTRAEVAVLLGRILDYVKQ